MVQVLSRHGARYPTASKSALYKQTIQRIKARVEQFSGIYAFLKHYEYTLGADQLTLFGQQEMIHSGFKFYNRYHVLADYIGPFVRASGEARVVQSARNFTQGYQQAKLAKFGYSNSNTYPSELLIISEAEGSNNTCSRAISQYSLNHGLCNAFEKDAPFHKTASEAQSTWMDVFAPSITARLNKNLPGANISKSDTISLMDLCPFGTVASIAGRVSPFCNLFTTREWQEYDYYETLGKYYGYSYGNVLGPTQGIVSNRSIQNPCNTIYLTEITNAESQLPQGFTNELIARLTHSPVIDSSSSNHTLDSDSLTFPLSKGPILYADFSHDNDMTLIFSALGLYNTSRPLSNVTIGGTDKTNGYSASMTVPFAARAYFEKLHCGKVDQEYVRVIVNDKVQPLEHCGGDALGRCTLKSFVESLSFARAGGLWNRCRIR